MATKLIIFGVCILLIIFILWRMDKLAQKASEREKRLYDQCHREKKEPPQPKKVGSQKGQMSKSHPNDNHKLQKANGSQRLPKAKVQVTPRKEKEVPAKSPVRLSPSIEEAQKPKIDIPAQAPKTEETVPPANLRDTYPVTKQKTERQAPDSKFHSGSGFDLLSCSVQGESHISSGKECQDFSGCWEEGDSRICIISDGHGGERYFRSRRGAEKAVGIAYNAIKEFLTEDQSISAIQGKCFKSFGIKSEREIQTMEDATLVTIFDQLFRSIVCQWHSAIEEDAKFTTINEWENKNVKQEYIQQLKEKRDIEKIYGCTLLAYAQTGKVWFAFQIGDGKCLAMNVNGESTVEPIPWDNQCFLNKTTSLCGSHAADEFRFCCQGDGSFPCAVFIGSDGIDDTFHTDGDLKDFYIKLGKYSLDHGCQETAAEMKASLPILSKRGSQDDMSVAFVIDRNKFKGFIPQLEKEQIETLDEQIRLIEEELKGLKIKITILSEKETLNKSEQINLQYYMKDIEEKESEHSILRKRKTSLES